MANWEQNKRILQELVKLPQNSHCADCGAPDPDWASYKLGLFVCLNCSGIHRNLSSRVKSIKLDNWEDELVELMKSNGNARATALYEKALPPYYYRPQQTDSAVLREQWIRAKYERKEFTGETKYPPPFYTTGFYEGMLWKKGKVKSQFLKRKFVLSEPDFTLLYYNKENESKGPKAVIAIKDLNVTFQPEKIGHPHGMQITYLNRVHTRNLFVYHESPEEIVTWYNALRAVRYKYLKTAYPTATEADLISNIMHNYPKEGYMEKTGPLQKEPFKKRWFILDSHNRKLLYFKGRTQKSLGSSSLAQKTTVTLLATVLPNTHVETNGSLASPWRRPTGSLCLCASTRRNRESGWMPSGRSYPGPWYHRITPVSISRRVIWQ
ncbi:arf-GAP with dual PH domain-containing protein 2-like isoform X3 [Entelurus aequoreus]|uniref:arf-GAP with dual PH domain-containing protein 2-like isoform X3 n=1 Tax=Entelurus aequoreus TaxID=161455 RepID=UPI002B1CE9BF|nr:arf-GAP with dual PH domain-containing protein 2-like isoform X3 [Entelurus aequoreus]